MHPTPIRGGEAPVLAGRDLTYAHPGAAPLFERVQLSLHRHKRYGLVGDNGAGKTTLLRLLLGELRPTGGAIEREGTVAYLAQDEVVAGETIADVLGLGPILRAIHRIGEGDASPSLFDVIADDWDAEEQGRRLLARVGLSPEVLSRATHSLSGGELTRVRLAALLRKAPDVLILDEPTNHLDADARAFVAKLLKEFPGAVLVASHDRRLLADFDEIWDLRRGSLRRYGGGFDGYAAQRAAEDAAARAAADGAAQALARTKAQASATRERQAQRSARAKKAAPDLGLPQIVIGMMKRRAERTAAKLDGVHEKRVEDAQDRLADAKARLPDDDAIKLELAATRVPEGRPVVALEGFRDRLWERPLDALVVGPRRIALTGGNGAGKSTLLRALAAGTSPGARILTGPVVYLDQSLALLDHALPVVENFRRAAPSLTETDRRIRLGRFLFDPDRALRPVASLSGGERMRAALACALLGDAPAKLLLLDEPTNHLDLRSLAQLERALAGFGGALVVVSHDAAFLDALGLDAFWRLDRRGLRVE